MQISVPTPPSLSAPSLLCVGLHSAGSVVAEGAARQSGDQASGGADSPQLQPGHRQTTGGRQQEEDGDFGGKDQRSHTTVGRCVDML